MADLTRDQLRAYLTQQGISWVVAKREQNRPGGRRLSAEMLDVLSQYFPFPLLDQVRTYYVPAIENPPFLAEVQRLIPRLPDFSAKGGITFDDTICLKQSEVEGPRAKGLIFHECVHVCQYNQLGVVGFMQRYVQGFMDNDYDENRIPLEQDAYCLQQVFETGTHAFAVEPIVRRRLVAEA